MIMKKLFISLILGLGSILAYAQEKAEFTADRP